MLPCINASHARLLESVAMYPGPFFTAHRKEQASVNSSQTTRDNKKETTHTFSFSFSFNTCCVCSGDKPCTLLVVKIVGASPVAGSDGGVGSCWFSCVSRRFGSCDVADDDDDSVRSIEAVGLAASASPCRFVASVLNT